MNISSIVFCMLGIALVAVAVNGEDTYVNCIKTPKAPTCGSEKYCRSKIAGCFRTIDGTCNNWRNPQWGSVNTPLRRLAKALYSDVHNLDTPRGHRDGQKAEYYPTPHQVSKAIFTPIKRAVKNSKKLSTIFMTFGQFLDHDISIAPHESCNLTNDCSQAKAAKYPCFPIKFDYKKPRCTGLGRAKPACKKHKYEQRNQVNELTSFIDLSQVYGTTAKKSKELRKNDGSGQLRVDKDNIVPIDHVASAKKTCINPAKCHLVGDERGEENIALFAMHILWVREHNRIAKELKKLNPHWSGGLIYQVARKINGAVFQHIVYTEYLPNVIYSFRRRWGSRFSYTRYNPRQDPSAINAFGAAAFRYGHGLVPNFFTQLNANFEKIRPDIPLQKAFFNSLPITKSGIAPTLMGLCGNMSNSVGNILAEDLITKLFIFPGSKLHNDLTALNIQRGRDHGIPMYGEWRKQCNHPSVNKFDDMKYTPKETRDAFKKIYSHPDDIDLFAAGITEHHIGSKVVGPTFHCIIRKQFQALRDGDRFFYTHRGSFRPSQLREIKKMSLSKVLCNNLKEDGMVSLQRSAFKVFESKDDRRVNCDRIPQIDLRAWKDNRKCTV